MLGVSLTLFVALPLHAVELAPHQAFYQMTLAEADRTSDVLAAAGAMEYRFVRGCDGWTVENHTRLRLSYRSGGQTETDWTFASWEATDGATFRFHTRYDQDGRTLERLQGHAKLDRPGATGSAIFSQPSDRVVKLPQGTMFPTAHMQEFIIAAEAGQRNLSKVVFDGASLDNPYLVVATFAPLGQSAAEAFAKEAGLPPGRAWWTRMAFFPYYGRTELPEFELGAHYRADGIADSITQSFDDFTLSVRLKRIELLPKPDC
jgi:hypothetical protein